MVRSDGAAHHAEPEQCSYGACYEYLVGRFWWRFDQDHGLDPGRPSCSVGQFRPVSDLRCDGGDVGDELVVCGPVELSSVAQADAYSAEAQEVAYGQRYSLALVERVR